MLGDEDDAADGFDNSRAAVTALFVLAGCAETDCDVALEDRASLFIDSADTRDTELLTLALVCDAAAGGEAVDGDGAAAWVLADVGSWTTEGWVAGACEVGLSATAVV